MRVTMETNKGAKETKETGSYHRKLDLQHKGP